MKSGDRQSAAQKKGKEAREKRGRDLIKQETSSITAFRVHLANCSASLPLFRPGGPLPDVGPRRTGPPLTANRTSYTASITNGTGSTFGTKLGENGGFLGDFSVAAAEAVTRGRRSTIGGGLGHVRPKAAPTTLLLNPT